MRCSGDKTKKILLVDDTDAIRSFLGDMLRIEGGVDVDTAANGAVARDMGVEGRHRWS